MKEQFFVFFFKASSSSSSFPIAGVSNREEYGGVNKERKNLTVNRSLRDS